MYEIRVVEPGGSVRLVAADERMAVTQEDGFTRMPGQPGVGVHATLEPDPRGVVVTDLPTSQDTYVNGAQIARPTFCSVGDRIRAGSLDLTIVSGPASRESFAGEDARAAPPDPVLHGGRIGAVAPQAGAAPPPPPMTRGAGRPGGLPDLARLAVGVTCALAAVGVTALAAWILLDDGTRTTEELAGSVGLASGMGGIVAAGAFIYWDAWTLKAHGVQIGTSSAAGWAIFTILIAVAGIPWYLASRSRVSPRLAQTGVPGGLRSDGDGVPKAVGALLGLGIVGLIILSSALSFGAIAASTPRVLDTALVERQMEAWIRGESGGTRANVQCPEMEWEVGNKFRCVATVPLTGERLAIRGTMEDDAGNVTWMVA